MTVVVKLSFKAELVSSDGLQHLVTTMTMSGTSVSPRTVSLVAAGIHPLAPFLSHPGNPPIPWKTWISAFDTYLCVSGMASINPERLRALFVH